jgi:hypothetical protein
MTQMNLFEPQRRRAEAAPSDPAFVRKHLTRALNTARAAQFMPWAPVDAQDWARKFPELAKALPPEEGEALTLAFAEELARLAGD